MSAQFFQHADKQGNAPTGTQSQKYFLHLFDQGTLLFSLNHSSYRIVFFGKQNINLQIPL